MLSTLKKIAHVLTTQEKRKIIFLLGGIFIMAVIEVVAVTSIMPFMMLVTNSSIIHTNILLQSIYEFFNFQNDQSFLLLTGSAVFLLIVFGNFFSAFMAWKTIRFSYQQGQTLSLRLFKHYLNKSYEFFILNNSSELTKNILHEVNRFVTGLLLPLMQMFVKGIVSLFILGMLFYVDPLLAISVSALLGGIYFFVYLLIKKRLGAWGTQSSLFHSQRFKIISEALDGIKELKVGNKENYFLKRFNSLSECLAIIESKQQNAPQVTRYFLEAAAFGGMMLIILYLTSFKKDMSQTIPLLALYAFSGYRLMPALQQIFSGMSLVKYNNSALEIIAKELGANRFKQDKHIAQNRVLKIADKIELRNITYNYPDSSQPTINDVSIEIPMNSLVGFMGKTGSGKSTLAHILIGLLKPSSGQFYVDGKELNASSLKSLQKNIGYVPQTIFLTDDSITNNIAFGLENNEIDMSAVVQAATLANIHDFILSLPEGYNTIVGEKGVRLSGGQRQRIGIARSLYHSPALLILDEATSALDSITEHSIMNEINNLRDKVTVVIIAHRIATFKACNNIYLFEHGKVLTQGSYEELYSTSDIFKKMNHGH